MRPGAQRQAEGEAVGTIMTVRADEIRCGDCLWVEVEGFEPWAGPRIVEIVHRESRFLRVVVVMIRTENGGEGKYVASHEVRVLRP